MYKEKDKLMSLQLNVKDPSGAQRFITPIIMLAIAGKQVQAKKEVALDLAYIVKAVCDNDFTGVTTSGAVSHVGKVVSGMKEDTTYTLYLPAKYEDRESDDLKKWTACATIKQDAMSKAVTLVNSVESILSSARDALKLAQAEADKITSQANIPTPAHSQPEYFTGTASKRGSSKKEVTSLF